MALETESSQPVDDPYSLEVLCHEASQYYFHFQYDPVTTSTRSLAYQYTLEHPQDRAIFLTDHQTQGVGRSPGQTWEDTKGSSVLLSALVHLPPDHSGVIADLVGLRVLLEIAQHTGTEGFCLKWPNDLLFESKKFGGMLVENITDDDRKYVATSIGIGINIHEQKQAKADTFTYPATTLDDALRTRLSRTDIAVAVIRGIVAAENDLLDVIAGTEHATRLDLEWIKRSCLMGKHIQLIHPDMEELTEGKVIDMHLGQGITVESDGKQNRVLTYPNRTHIRLTE